jgi:hypothetical protein
MKLSKLMLPLALVLVLVLVIGAVYAVAQCGGQAKAGSGCAMKAGGGCGMQGGGGCGMMRGRSCGMCRGVPVVATRALTNGTIALINTPRGLLLAVTNQSHQGDPMASVSVFGTGPEHKGSIEAKRIAAGRFFLGEVQGAKLLSVRVSQGATSEVVYFGLADVRIPASPSSGCGARPSGVCKCGPSCKCATGDHSACKCGAPCRCGQKPAGKPAGGCGCGGK